MLLRRYRAELPAGITSSPEALPAGITSSPEADDLDARSRNFFAAKQRAAVVVRPVANRAEPLRDWNFSNNIAVLTMGPIA